MFISYFKLALKEIIRRKSRTFFTLAGIILSGALLSSSAIVIISLKNSLNFALTNVGADIVIQAHGEPCVWAPVKLPTNLNPIPSNIVDQTRKIKGVRKASSVLIAWAFDGEQGNLHPTVIAGVEPWERELGPLKLSQAEGQGNILLKGRYLNDLDGYSAVLDYDFAKFLNVDTGSNILLGGYKFEVVGIVQIGREARIAGAQAFLPLHTVQEMLKKGDIVNTVFVKLDNSGNSRNIIKELQNLYGKNSSVTASLDFPATIRGLADIMDIFMFGVSLVIILAALGFSLRSIASSINERRRELCIMKAIGWFPGQLRNLLFTESAILGFIGSSAGIILGNIFAFLYITCIKLKLPEALVNFPPCSFEQAKTELPVNFPKAGAALVTLLTVLIITLISVLASWFSSSKLKNMECSPGLRSL